MVRLLLANYVIAMPLILCFNPTMVRLLLELEEARSVYEGLFQSHNGAIAAKKVSKSL